MSGFKPTCLSQITIIQLCYDSFTGKFTAIPKPKEIKNKLIWRVQLPWSCEMTIIIIFLVIIDFY